MSVKMNHVYLNAAQSVSVGLLVTAHREEAHEDGREDKLLVVLHQEELLGGRAAVRGWVMVELIDGNEREMIRLDNDGNRRTVEETQALLAEEEAKANA